MKQSHRGMSYLTLLLYFTVHGTKYNWIDLTGHDGYCINIHHRHRGQPLLEVVYVMIDMCLVQYDRYDFVNEDVQYK